MPITRPWTHSFEKEVPPQVEVLRGPIWEPYAAYRKLTGAKSTEVTEISSGPKTFKQRLSLWIRANLFVPDPRVGWVRPSVKRLKAYLKEHPVDVMVTTGPPHSVHLIGERLHKDLGIPWIPDFRDPWSKMYYLKHLPMTGAQLETAAEHGAAGAGQLQYRFGLHAAHAGGLPGPDPNARCVHHQRL